MRSLWKMFNTPLPLWLGLALVCGSVASAAVGTVYASLNVPSTGTITDTNATVSTCVGTTAGKVYTYATNCLKSISATSPITVSAGPTPVVACSTCTTGTRAKLEIPLCYQSGTVATSASCPTQPIVAFSTGQITALRAFCTTHDNGSTVFTFYTVNATTGAQTSQGTLTLSASNYESDGSITTVNLSAPEGLYGNVTTAGTAANCSFVAEGWQTIQ